MPTSGSEQIEKNPGSGQVMVPDAKHFFEGREDELVRIIVAFLDRTFKAGKAPEAPR